MKRSVQEAQGKDPVDCEKAQKQGTELRRVLEENGVEIPLISAISGLPDMVFTANAGFVYGGKIVLSRFRHEERRPEEAVFEAYFKKETSLEVLRLPESHTRIGNEGEEKEHHDSPLYFEGHGDMLFYQDIVFAGYGKRSNIAGIVEAIRLSGFPRQCVFLELVDDNFYHLDTCFCPIGKYLLYYPGAFSLESQKAIEREVKRKGGELVRVSEADAMNFLCNGIPLERKGKWQLIVGSFPSKEVSWADFTSPKSRERLELLGIETIFIDLSEFHKSGGGARCLVLFF